MIDSENALKGTRSVCNRIVGEFLPFLITKTLQIKGMQVRVGRVFNIVDREEDLKRCQKYTQLRVGRVFAFFLRAKS